MIGSLNKVMPDWEHRKKMNWMIEKFHIKDIWKTGK